MHQPPSGADGQLFVVEQPGRVKVVGLDGGGESPFLNIEGKVASGGERGLLSIAFAPDYADSGRFYVYYTAKGGDLTVEEYRRSANDPLQADQSSARTLLDIEHSRFPNHNGGQLQFGPDGFLYVGTGDGGSFGDPERERAGPKQPARQDPAHRPAQRRPLRDPRRQPVQRRARGATRSTRWGCATRGASPSTARPATSSIGDVGQDRREEIDYETAKSLRGANFGWDAFEGFRRYKSPDASQPPRKHEKPIDDYPTSGGNCAVTGGYVSATPSWAPLFGRYVYADHCMGEIRSLIPSPGGARDDGPIGISEPRISSFGEDAAGHVYVVSLAGRVSRLAPGVTESGQPASRTLESAARRMESRDRAPPRPSRSPRRAATAPRLLRETFDVHNPADGSVVETLPIDGPDRVADVVARVRANQPEWEAMGIAGRYEWLGKLRDWLIENGEPVAETMRSETGKVRGDAALETPYLADLINFYGQNGPSSSSPTSTPPPTCRSSGSAS